MKQLQKCPCIYVLSFPATSNQDFIYANSKTCNLFLTFQLQINLKHIKTWPVAANYLQIIHKAERDSLAQKQEEATEQNVCSRPPGNLIITSRNYNVRCINSLAFKSKSSIQS